LLAVSLLVLSAVTVPPCIVVLGLSGEPAQLLARQLAWRIAPLRPVHLLSYSARAAFDPLFTFARIRTRRGWPWEESVRLAGRLAACLVVDTRHPTPLVEQEALDALEPELIGKAVFVGNPDSPVLARLALQIGTTLPALRTASEDQFLRWMKPLRWELAQMGRIRRGSVFERMLIGTRRKPSVVRPGGPCDVLLAEMHSRGMTGDELVRHVEPCDICHPDRTPYLQTDLHNPAPVGPNFPHFAMIGIKPPFWIDWETVEQALSDPRTEVFVLMGNSPAARHRTWVIDVVRLFAGDPSLGLVVEDDIRPISRDPVIIVRRELLLRWKPGVDTAMSVVARELARTSISASWKSRLLPLSEQPRSPAL
jgi:hypothetical protein